MIHMVGSTRGTPKGFNHGQTSGSQQPPPSSPNLAEVMALLTELIRQLVQGQQNQPRSQQQGHIPPAPGYQDFFGTHPPLFHQTDEPLDADAWLRTIESKFTLLPVPCSEANKTLERIQDQLQGASYSRRTHGPKDE